MKKLILALALLLSLISCDSCTTGPQPDTEIHVIQDKSGKPLVWDQMLYPIHLDVYDQFSTEDIADIIGAVNSWESLAERDLFNVSLIGDEIAILNPEGGHVSLSFATLSERIEGKHLGETRPYTVRGTTRVHSMTVEVDRSLLGDREFLYPVVLHELGHVLLIHHDIYKESVMYLDVTESSLAILPKHVTHIQKRYGPFLMPR